MSVLQTVVPFYVLTSSMYEFQFLCILDNMWLGQSFILVMLLGIVGARVLICSSLMKNDDEYFFMGSFKIQIFSLAKCLFKHFAHFLMCCFLTEFWELFFVRCIICKYFFPSYGLSFHFLDSVFWRAEVLILVKLKLLHCSLVDCVFALVLKKYLPNSVSQRFSTGSSVIYVLH